MKKLLLMLACAAFTMSCSDDDSSTSTNTPVASTVKDKAGNEYKVVKIGGQTWMVENFNLEAEYEIPSYDSHSDDSMTVAVPFDKNEDNRQNYGLLYCYNPAELEALAPEGYRLPTKADWNALFANVGGASKAAKLKSKELWTSPNASANNEFGFNAVPGGYSNAISREFIQLGNMGAYWCAPYLNDTLPNYVTFSYQSNEAKFYIGERHQQMSVRFIKK